MKLATLLAAALVAAVLTTTAALGAAGGAPVQPQIIVTMDGDSITVSGTLESGAVTVHSVATGSSQGAPLFVHLNDGVTADEFITFLHSNKANDPNNVAPYGSIVFDAGLGSGTHDAETKLQPGDYVALDTSANNPNDWPYTSFSISENPTPAALSPMTQWQKSIDFRFRGTQTWHVGQQIRLSNAGWVVHMDIAIGAKSKAAGQELSRRLRSGHDQKIGSLLTGQFVELFGPLSHGAVQQFALDMQPGWYVEACFMDTQDGREHTRLGMTRLIHVVP